MPAENKLREWQEVCWSKSPILQSYLDLAVSGFIIIFITIIIFDALNLTMYISRWGA